jgi:hypothetical protein
MCDKGFQRDVVVSSRYYPRIFLEGLTKATTALNKNNQCPGQDLKEAPPKYKCSKLPLDQTVPIPK